MPDPKLGSTIQDFDRIVSAVRKGFCIPFLGAGVSMSFRDWRNGQGEVAGCPSGSELRNMLEEALRSKIPQNRDLDHVPLGDLPSVAEFYAYIESGHREEIEEIVTAAIRVAAFPRPIHWVLAGIPSIRCVFTTNYDELVEEACRVVTPSRNLLGPYIYDQSQDKQEAPSSVPIDIATNRRFEPVARSQPGGYPLLLYKMHGSVQLPNSMLITTYDYVRYITTWQNKRTGIPKEFRDLLLKNTILFLGYGLSDWNFRIIWEAMISSFPGGRFPIQSYAIKKDVTDFERSLFATRNIALIDCDLTLLARALAEEFGFEIPEPRASAPSPGGSP